MKRLIAILFMYIPFLFGCAEFRDNPRKIELENKMTCSATLSDKHYNLFIYNNGFEQTIRFEPNSVQTLFVRNIPYHKARDLIAQCRQALEENLESKTN